MFGNPVPGRIAAKHEAWTGPPGFRVTATFGDHRARRPPQSGIDLGNGRCGGNVLAAEAGVVQRVFVDPGNGALIIRIDHGVLGGARTITGYAHVSTALVREGQRVTRGQTIALVGKTGADACHLHWGVNRGGTEVDGWPLLDQNEEDDMRQIVVTRDPFPEPRFYTAGPGSVTAYSATGKSKTVKFAAPSRARAAGTARIAHFDADGDELDPQPTPNGTFLEGLDGAFAGWFLVPRDVVLDPAPPEPPDTAKEGAQAAAEAAQKVADSLP
jgi:murein DD-endopeptidase MepM/ murein hydrolase activator NlpD